jgi:hypothetical protein
MVREKGIVGWGNLRNVATSESDAGGADVAGDDGVKEESTDSQTVCSQKRVLTSFV